MDWTALAPHVAALPSDQMSRRAYLRWIKTLPCLVCRRRGSDYFAVDAHHAGPRGLSQKANDYQAVPLCHFDHHQEGPHSVHRLGPRRFEEHHAISFPDVIAGLLSTWTARASR